MTCSECFAQCACESISSLPALRVGEGSSVGGGNGDGTNDNTNDSGSGADMLPAEQPSCGLCYELFANDPPALVPRRLTCGHIACTRCLEGEWDEGEVTCSECFAQCACESISALPALRVGEGSGGDGGNGDGTFRLHKQRFSLAPLVLWQDAR